MEDTLIAIFLFGGISLTCVGMFMLLSASLASTGVWLFVGGIFITLLTVAHMMF